MKKAIVIVPTYNERENIQNVVPALQKEFAKIKNWEMGILVVDDNSPDKTADVVRDLQKKNKNLYLLVNQAKSGLGGAYLKGMAKAFGTGKETSKEGSKEDLHADVVFEFDADLSHDPTKIPLFMQKIDEGYDMVLGSRYIPGGGIPDDWGIDRKFLSVIGNIIIMIILTDFRIRDWTGGYRAITKKVYEAVYPELQSERFSGYTFQIGFLHKAVQKGFKIVEVPFHFADRTIGYSKLSSEYLKNILLYILKERVQGILKSRIFKFVVVGGLGALTQLILLKVFWLFLTGKVDPFWSYKIASLLAIECAIILNFILNNLWTFADRKLEASKILQKFLQFNIASSGSIIIQLIIAFVGDIAIGAKTPLLTLPLINFIVNWGLVFTVVGILIGMFWNFFAYNAFIWKKK